VWPWCGHHGAGADRVGRGRDVPHRRLGLFGIDSGDLVEERIPSLVLTDDFLQANTHLQNPGSCRSFISCAGGLDLLRDLLTRERGRIAAISLSPWLYDTIEVTADGQIDQMSHPDLADAVKRSLPTFNRPEAYAQLMSLPTVRKSALFEDRRHFTG
jgi:hypothetical protein